MNSERDQKIIHHLQNSWQSIQNFTPGSIANIATFITDLQEPYKAAAIETVAEQLVNAIRLCILTLMATFQKNAENEGISAEDCQETLSQVLPEAFHTLNEISQRISIPSLETLLKLCNITGSLLMLSQTDSAEEAQNWLYELPPMYARQLQQEHLLSNTLFSETKQETDPTSLKLSASKATFGSRQIILNQDNVSLPSLHYVA
jgi:hypothetical protein